MPRKQRFKPSRKPRPVTEATQTPIAERSSSSRNAAGPEAGSREADRRELPPDDARREEPAEGPPRR